MIFSGTVEGRGVGEGVEVVVVEEDIVEREGWWAWVRLGGRGGWLESGEGGSDGSCDNEMFAGP